jgi:hypothetical protein
VHSVPLSLAGLPGLAPLLVAQARLELSPQLAALGAELVYDAAVAPRDLAVAAPSAHSLEVGERIVQQWLGRQAAVRQASPTPGAVSSAHVQPPASPSPQPLGSVGATSPSPQPQGSGRAASPAALAAAAAAATVSTPNCPAQEPSPSPSRGLPGTASLPPPGLAGLPGRAAFSRLALGSSEGGSGGSSPEGAAAHSGPSYADPYAEPYSAFSGPGYSGMAASAGGFAPLGGFAVAPAFAPAVPAIAQPAQPMSHADTHPATEAGSSGGGGHGWH